MRYARRLSTSKWQLLGALPLCAALALGCHGTVGDVGSPGAGGNGAGGNNGTGGMDVPCSGPSDPRMLPASQRILLLTSAEMINTISYLFGATEATAIKTAGMFNVTLDSDRTFPPAEGEPVKQITDTPTLQPISNMALAVAQYVNDNFATVTGCTTASDTCAQTYLTTLAAKAYRRQLTSAETTRFSTLYTNLRSQIVNGYAVTATIQQATQYSVYALLMTPQLLWRWEIGNSATTSTSPPGMYLTDDELASNVSFFLTDQPPDDMLLAAAKAGTLRSNLASHITRILATQQSKDWMRTVMEIYYLLNALPKVINTIDGTKFPLLSAGLLSDMQTESQMFLDNTLWNGKLTDLLTSRTTYLNTYLAENIYKVPDPAGATLTNFVQTTLPSDQRSGILTNAGFITRAARPDGGSVVSRGLAVRDTMLCLTSAGPPDNLAATISAAKSALATQTVQQQVAYRASIPICASCHSNFDPYGLVLDYYDNLGTYRTTDDLGMPVDAHTTLPAVVGGATVQNAIDLSNQLSKSPAFINCMAASMLQYAMVDETAPVQLPLIPSQSGCAAADVVSRFQSTSTQTYTDLIKATAASPAFVLRAAAP
jgi:hypothetical protein